MTLYSIHVTMNYQLQYVKLCVCAAAINLLLIVIYGTYAAIYALLYCFDVELIAMR